MFESKKKTYISIKGIPYPSLKTKKTFSEFETSIQFT